MSDYDNDVAGDAVGFTALGAASKWESRRLLLDKLMRYPSIMDGNTTVTTFYNAWLNSSPGLFAQVENQVREAYAIEAADQSSMDAIENQRSSIQQQLIALQSNQTLPLTPTTNPALMASLETLLAQLPPLHQQEAVVKAQISQKQVTKLQNALAANALLPANTLQEQNRRMFNQLSISLFLNGTLTATEESQLLALTASGQTDGGLAVEDAKMLLPKCGPNAGPRSSSTSNGAVKKLGNILEEPPYSITIQPNPVSGTLSVLLNGVLSGRVVLYDLTGRLCLEVKKTESENTVSLNTQSVPNGLYFVSFEGFDGQKAVQKILVQH